MKFKLWNILRNRFEESFCVDRDGDFYLIDETCHGQELSFFCYPQEYKLLQSTGLFDSNGKEIFEGDIVAEERDYDKDDIYGDELTYTRNCIVRKGHGYFYHDEDDPHSLIMYPRFVKVIGNMYENPGLVDPNDLV